MSNLYYYVEDSNIRTNINQMTFPGGEVGVDINSGATLDTDASRVKLVAHLQSSNDVMAMLLATEALRYHFPVAEIDLCMPYIPYARQDRRCNYGEALSIKVFAALVNSQNYRTVYVLDPHSAVSAGLIDRCFVADQYDLFAHTKLSWFGYTIVAPDLGAVKKAEDFAKRVGASGVAIANKKRELSTGKIVGMELITGTGPGEKLVVLDDICDGGRTFVELAKLLKEREPASLELYVSHGIFSAGIEVLDMYDLVVTTNSFHPEMKSQGNVKILPTVG